MRGLFKFFLSLCVLLSLAVERSHQYRKEWDEKIDWSCTPFTTNQATVREPILPINLADADPAMLEQLALRIRDALLVGLEDVRSIMQNGLPDAGVSPLDPLNIGNLPFNVAWDDNTVYGNLTGTSLYNLATFIPTQMYVNIQFAVLINMTVETATLELNGTYTMGGHALGVDVTGDGNYRIDLNDLRFGFFIYFRFSHLFKYLQVGAIDADFTLGDAEVHFDHLMGGGVVGGLINEALSTELPVILKIVEDNVLPPLLDTLETTINDVLCQFPLLPFIP